MTDYVSIVRNPDAAPRPFRDEVERLAHSIAHETTLNDGVLRWTTNDSVPPADIVDLAVELGYGVDAEACRVARDKDLEAFAARMRAARANRSAEQRQEEALERRAAFGPGETVIDVLTGERFST